MAYAYSRARKSFHQEVNDLLASSQQADSNPCPPRVSRLAHASAIVLTSAKVENYLEDLITDWSLALSSSTYTAGALPSKTRAFLLSGASMHAAYRKLLLQEKGEKDFLEMLGSQLGPTGEFRFVRIDCVIDSTAMTRIYKDVKYPSKENLVKLFSRCGIDNIFTALNKLANRDVELLHRSFSDLRTSIAHRGLPVGINGSDVRTRIKEMSSVVGYLDRVFYAHNRAFFDSSTWIV